VQASACAISRWMTSRMCLRLGDARAAVGDDCAVGVGAGADVGVGVGIGMCAAVEIGGFRPGRRPLLAPIILDAGAVVRCCCCCCCLPVCVGTAAAAVAAVAAPGRKSCVKPST
jgi:NADPH-dependent 2,4-dienoyl-CoA reductase/sulfur reductase-like enzyme